ncbi:ABC transporter ATP-binding protein [Bacillota bacterium LX-D]|nr:ABC transporter ATP-binding protein [Bacillota bacterium LX-D]
MGKTAIAIKNLSFAYTPNEFILKDISFDIGEHEFVAIIGENGAGKSTLLKNITGLLKPTSGQILINGKNTKEVPIAKLANEVGYVLQNPDRQLFAQTVWQEVAFGLKNSDLSQVLIKEKVEKALHRVGLNSLAEEFPPSLSKSTRAKVAIAAVLAMEPKIIILDEPTVGQDYKGISQIMDLAAEFYAAGHTVVLVTHQMSLVSEYCERIIALYQGKVLLDTTTRDFFAHIEELKKTKIRPAEITQLGYDLSLKLPLAQVFLSTQELGEELLKLRTQKNMRTGTEG